LMVFMPYGLLAVSGLAIYGIVVIKRNAKVTVNEEERADSTPDAPRD
jgi:hypothetical protein